MNPWQMKIGERHISWSQIWEYQHCPWRWGLKNGYGVRKPRVMRTPEAGSIIHEGVAGEIKFRLHANMLTGEERIIRKIEKEMEKVQHLYTLKKITEEQADEDQAILSNLTLPCTEVVLGWSKWMDWERWESVRDPRDGEPIIEKSFMIDMPPWKGIMGVLDWCAKDLETGLVYVIDWKTRLQMLAQEVEETNLQKTIYTHMLQQLGIKVDGSRICQIWREPQKKPELTAVKKTISRKKIRTTWETWRQGCIDLDGDPADFMEMQAKCNPEEDFYRWSTVHRADEEIEATWQSVRVTALRMAIDMQNIQNRDYLPVRHLGMRDCATCYTKDTCMERLRGTDWPSALLVSGLYQKEEPTDIREPDTTEDDQLFTTKEQTDGVVQTG